MRPVATPQVAELHQENQPANATTALGCVVAPNRGPIHELRQARPDGPAPAIPVNAKTVLLVFVDAAAKALVGASTIGNHMDPARGNFPEIGTGLEIARTAVGDAVGVDVNNPRFGAASDIVILVSPLGLPRGSNVRNVNPADIRWTQRTAGGRGRAAAIRESMAQRGYKGDSIDLVVTRDGLVTVDHTRAAVALEQGINSIPGRVHLPWELLPADMLGRFGKATTWGEAAAYRTANQRPPLPPTGPPTPPRLPTP